MNRTHLFILAALLAGGLAGCKPSGTSSADAAKQGDWLTDFPAAQARAKAEGKLLLLEFTGSDWCPPCIMLKKQVFSTPAFNAFARDNLVLVEADFPRSRRLPEPLRQANEALARQFGVEGFPTVIVFNSEGRKLWQMVGLEIDSAKDFVAKLQELKRQ